MSNEELDLLNEMKENCLKKGQYIDEKAKDKFNMLCHCEDFIIENYEQSKEIERLNKYKNFIKSIIITLEPWSKNEKGYELHNISKQELYKELYELRQEILKGE